MGRRATGMRLRWRGGWPSVRFTHQGQEHHISLGTQDPLEAERRAAFEYAEVISGRRASLGQKGQRLERPELAVALAQWAAGYEGTVHASFVATLVTYAKHFLGFFCAWERLTDASCRDYGRARLRAVARTTVLRETSYLRAFVAWAAERGYLAVGPLVPRLPPKASGRRVGRQRAFPVEISPAEAAAIIARLPAHSKSIDGRTWPVRDRFAFAWETGLRPATLSKLRTPEDWRPGAIELHVSDDDDKARYGRVLPLSDEARRILERVAPAEGALLFGAHNFAKALKRAAKAVLGEELGRKFAPYDFRHGRGTQLADEGAPLTGIAYLLGHKKLTTTDRYLRPNRRAAARALQCGEVSPLVTDLAGAGKDPGRAPLRNTPERDAPTSVRGEIGSTGGHIRAIAGQQGPRPVRTTRQVRKKTG